MGKVSKPHVVCVPFPLQGHIIPMLQLAKLLHYKGFHVTFVNTEYNHKRMLDSRDPNSLNQLPDFHFVTIPLEHPPSDSYPTLNLQLYALRKTCNKDFSNLFRDLVSKLNDTTSSSSSSFSSLPISCIISDTIMDYTIDIAEELKVPNVFLCAMSAAGYLSLKHSRDQFKQCIPLLLDPDNQTIDEKNLDNVMIWIPGAKGAPVKEISKFIKSKDEIESTIESCERDFKRASKASAVIFHTLEALDGEVMESLSPSFQKVYGFGPLQLLLDQICDDDRYNSIDCNLWNKESECIRWLDSKEPNSVIYINFGSVTLMTMEEVGELAWGLANSNHNFLWITRPDMVMGESAIMPPEFSIETKERGFIANWCSQEQVLNHPSIGGFMTHCGWNSIFESICAGVPMIGWPYFGEHIVNCKNICNKWGIGMELSSEFQRDEVEKLVKELMAGENGKKMKDKIMEWKRMVQEAITPNGSSSITFNNLVNEILLSKN